MVLPILRVVCGCAIVSGHQPLRAGQRGSSGGESGTLAPWQDDHDAQELRDVETFTNKHVENNAKDKVPGKIGGVKDAGGHNVIDFKMKDSTALVVLKEALGASGGENATVALIRALVDGEENELLRAEVASTLGDGGEIATEALSQALVGQHKDTSLTVRSKAAFALSRIGNKAAIEALGQALVGRNKDKEVLVRADVARALGAIRSTEALVLLGADATYSLRKGSIRDPSAIGVLTTALGYRGQELWDGDQDVRKAAVQALFDVGQMVALEAMSDSRDAILNDLHAIIHWVAYASVTETPDVQTTAREYAKRMREKSLENLRPLKKMRRRTAAVWPDVEEFLGQQVHQRELALSCEVEESRRREEVRRELALIREEVRRPAEVTVEDHHILRSKVEEPRRQEEVRGAHQRGPRDVEIATDKNVENNAKDKVPDKIGGAKDVGELIRGLLWGEDTAPRSPRMKVLQEAPGAIGGENAFEAFIQALVGGTQDTLVRRRVANALDAIGGEVATQVLSLVLFRPKKEDLVDLQEGVAKVLGAIGGENATQALVQALVHGTQDTLVRLRVASALGAIGSDIATEALIHALVGQQRDESVHVLSGVAIALSRIGDEAATEALGQALVWGSRHKDVRVRAEAARALGVIGTRDALVLCERVVADATHSPWKGTMNVAIYLLTTALGYNNVEQRDGNQDVRKEAVRALGNIGENLAAGVCRKASGLLGPTRAADAKALEALLHFSAQLLRDLCLILNWVAQPSLWETQDVRTTAREYFNVLSDKTLMLDRRELVVRPEDE